MACGCVGILAVWVSALAVPIIAHNAGGAILLVACAVTQFVGTLLGGRIEIDILFLATACACAAVTAFPSAGVIAFSLSFGALFRRWASCGVGVAGGPNGGRRYLDCVWQPVQAARLEFGGQLVAGCIFVPVVLLGDGGGDWDVILMVACIASGAIATVVRGDVHDLPDAPAPVRILVSYSAVCAGIACFSLGGILVISSSQTGWTGSQSTVLATATLLAGAMAAAALSGYESPTPAIKFRLGCYGCSATAMASMWAQSLTGYFIMSVSFGFSAALVLINGRNVCFNSGNVYFILSQRISDCVPPLLLALGLDSRELMQLSPAFIAVGLMLLPPGIDDVALIALARLR